LADSSAKATDKKVVASVPDWVSKITPFGDIRYRHEGFYNQQINEKSDSVVHARNRERIRWRFGAKYTYSDELSATFRLASGDPNDPISTNETLTGDFTRKHVNLDWAYMTVAPGKTFGWRPGVFTINAGKFPNPMFRVGEMVFDDDLSPEGLNETVQLLGEPCGPLDQVKIHAQQWTLNEVSNGEDAWMFGGQINPLMHFGDVQLEGGIGQYWWRDADLIAQAANTNSVIKQFTTNRVILASDGKTIDGFQSGFNTTNLNAAATIPNVAGGTMPLKIFGDYIYNWDAANTSRQGVQGGFRLGNPKEQGDWAASLLYEYLETDATISTFAWSDFGNGATNEQGPVVAFDYQLFKPLTLTARSYFTKFIDPAPDINNRMQVRLQLDAMLRF